MTSAERHDARYRRRKSKRDANRIQRSVYDNFESVFSYGHLYDAYKKCRRGVSWKASVQRFIAQAPAKIYEIQQILLSGSYRTPKFYEFDIRERGKTRHIRSVGITERVIQRCLCDYSLTPLAQKMLIYDNGASLRGKGYTFAVRRITKHLRDYMRRNGTDGYILIYDFKSFYDNISHDYIKKIISEMYADDRIKSIIFTIIDSFGDRGIGLGSQVSQVLALLVANRVDHYIKEELGFKEYARYNDDGYLIGTKADLQFALERIRSICAECGIVLHPRKTQIIKLTHGFVWLQIRFVITKAGKVIRCMLRKSIVRIRRKLKKYMQRFRKGLMSIGDIDASIRSWMAYAKNFCAHRSMKNLRTIYETWRNSLCTTSC